MKHMEEMKIAGLAMALCIVMLGIYIVVPKDGTVSHLTAIPDNNAAEPVTDSTSEGTADADFPIYTEDSYSSEPESSDDTGDGDSYTEEPTYDPGDNSYDGNTDSEANGADTSDTSDTSSDGTGEDAGNYEDPDSGSGEVVDDNDYSGTSDTDLDNSETEDTGSDGPMVITGMQQRIKRRLAITMSPSLLRNTWTTLSSFKRFITKYLLI